MATVHVKNIAPDTTETQVRDFFSFCGKISSLSLSKDGATQSATVLFEKPTAGKTALLLDSTQLGSNTVSVTAENIPDEKDAPVGESPATGATSAAGNDDELDQEDKPRGRIVAEYLAHGYVISDQAIERALALDKQHGLSTRFTNALQQFDKKYNATERAQSLDQKYGITQTAFSGWRSLHSYFDKAIDTPTGHRVNKFYQQSSNQVLDVHNEARRLANIKSGKPENASGPGAASDEKASEGAAGATASALTTTSDEKAGGAAPSSS